MHAVTITSPCAAIMRITWLMRRFLLAGLLLSGISLYAQSATQDPDSTSLDEVVVTGVRAGPRMWRVTRDDHELWLLGVLDPLPQQLQWQSQQVTEVVANVQAVLLDGMSVSADAGLFAKVGLYLEWRRMRKNPDQHTLHDVLPAELYARFKLLQRRYAKGEDLEALRPMVAAGRLYQLAVQGMGFAANQTVSHAVEKLAKQHAIKPRTLRLQVAEPKAVLESLNTITLNAEISCMAATLSNLESDLGALRDTANAWALGDVSALRDLLNVATRSACWQVLTSVPRLAQLTQQADQAWLALAEDSLQHNRSTLALRSIRDLLAPDGALAQLRAKGYVVDGP